MAGIEYLGANLDAIYHAEGRCTPNGATAFHYEYTLKDHLGNARVNFRANGAAVTFLEEMHYYPFGMLMEGIGTAAVTVNKYKYNGKELNDDLGLNLSDYGARWYDAVLGRWWSVDPLASGTVSVSTYAYVLNNPMALVDPNGMSAVGADGLTNEQWIKSSRPGDRNKAGEYKKENRQKEIENAKGNNKKLPDVWYANDALTTQQLIKAILTATTIWARQGYEKFKFRPISTSIAKQHKEAYEYQLFIAFTDKTPKDPNRTSPYPPGISTVSPNGRVRVFDKDNERQKGWLSYVNVGHSQIKFHANPSYAAGYVMAHEILHQMIAMANYYQFGDPYEKYWGDVGHIALLSELLI